MTIQDEVTTKMSGLIEEGEAFRTLSEQPQRTRYDVIVIGGAQAGLSAGYHLKQANIDFVILDAEARTGDTWRKRWDSLRLFSPARFSALDGMRHPGPQDRLPTKDEMADYLERYAQHFALPILHGVRVERLSREGDGYRVQAGNRTFEAAHVIVAMSNYQGRKVPAFATDLSPEIVQLHSSEYKNLAQLQPGPVLLVGAGNSGAEIAIETAAKHATFMSGPDPGGIALAEACEIAARLQRSGFVDYINVSGMTSLQYPGWIADITSPDALFADLSGALKKAAPGLPACVVSRIGSPEVAERVVASGQADMIGMARALISDPEFPNKTLRGDADDIRRCTYSNQSCIMGHSQGRGVGCVHNVSVGKEAQLGIGSLKTAAQRKKVVVVGGGPAGMAAARVAAERGHTVTLYEKDRALGGQNRMTAMIGSRRGFGEVTRWLERQIMKRQVEVLLGTAATADMILDRTPDAVIVASGSVPRRTGFSSQRPGVMIMPGVELPHVRTVWDVFGDPKLIGDSVILIDEDPHMAGIFAAEHLADQGKTIEIVTSQFHAGNGIHVNFIPDVYRRLARKGVTITANTSVLSIEPRHLNLLDGLTGSERQSRPVDTVILAMGNEVCDDLCHALKGLVAELHAIGDCVAPRKIDEAILDGERAGRMV